MSDINKYTTKEVLNKVLLDSSGDAVAAFSHTSQEAFNAALDDANSRLNVSLVGGTIGGDVTISGDLTVNGNGTGNYDEIINGELQITSTGVAGQPALAIDNSTAATFIHSAEIFAGSMTANQTNSIFIGRVGSTKNSAQIGFKYSSAGANANLLTLGHWGVNESLVIDGAGNVGIGTASPAELFHLASSEPVVRFTDTDDNNYHHIFCSSDDFTISADRNGTGAGNLIFRNGGTTERMRIDSNGHVGINCSGAELDQLFMVKSEGNNAYVAKFIASDASNLVAILQDPNGSGRVFIADEGGTPKITLRGNGISYFNGGNVGIGSDAPAAPLVIQTTNTLGLDSAPTGSVSIGSPSSTPQGAILGRQTANAVALNIMAAGVDGNTNGDMIFNTRENNNSGFATLTNSAFKFQHYTSDLVTILRNGNVGIGTASPASEGGGTTLHIAETGGSASAVLTLTGGSGGNGSFTGQIQFNDKDDTDERIAMVGASQSGTGTPPGGKLHFYTQIDGGALTEALNLDASQNATFAGGQIIYADGNVVIPATKAIFFDGGTHTKIVESSGDVLQIFAGNNDTPCGTFRDSGFAIQPTSKLWFDGAGDTYIHEQSADKLDFFVGNGTRMVLDVNSRISLSNNDGGASNTIFGKLAGNAVVSGTTNNVLIGHSSGTALNSGDSNVMIGVNAGLAGTSATNNIYIGQDAAKQADAERDNVVIGHQSFDGAVDGADYCVVIGSEAMRGAATQDGTVAIGTNALLALTSGAANVAIGANALDELTAGGYNTAIGTNALHQVDNDEAENVAIGYNAGSNLDGDGGTASKNVCIGSSCLTSSAGAINQIVIGEGTTGVANHSVTLGNANVTKIYMNQNGNGKVVLGSIEFDANQATLSTNANTLDDYEEGDWTPIITFGGNSNNVAYGTQAGKYTKVGRVIHCTGEIILTNKGDSTGAAKIGGLPVTTISNTDGAEGAVSLLVGNITFADYPQGYLAKNTQTIELSEVTNAGGVTDLSNADFANNSYIRVAFSFII